MFCILNVFIVKSSMVNKNVYYVSELVFYDCLIIFKCEFMKKDLLV